MLGVTPARASSSSEWPHWDVSTGRLQRLSTPPRLAARLMICSRSKNARRAVVAAADVEADHAAEARSSGASRWRDRDATRGPDSRRARRAASLRAHCATASAFAFCALTRTASVLSPRPSAYAGVRIQDAAEQLARLEHLLHQTPPSPASAPAVTSLWPLRYLVALCITTSTPSASGCWLTGLANVLSTTDDDAARSARRRDRARRRRSAASD